MEEGIGVSSSGPSGEHLLQGDMADKAIASEAIIGDRLCARHPKSQNAEAIIACSVLNRMAGLGMPGFFAIGA